MLGVPPEWSPAGPGDLAFVLVKWEVQNSPHIAAGGSYVNTYIASLAKQLSQADPTVVKAALAAWNLGSQELALDICAEHLSVARTESLLRANGSILLGEEQRVRKR